MASASVKVVVRLRPMNDEEKKGGETPVISASEEHKTVSVMKGEDMSRSIYSFNNVFTAFATQKEVFQGTLAPMIEDVLQGYESTVFAYGQTGTGKTHTMEGDLSDPLKYGVIPRSAEAIFRTLKKKKYESFKVTCSYLEIYNEDLCDILADRTSTTRLEIMNSKTGTFCRGLSEKEVRSSDDVLNLMVQAQQSRRIGETKMNKHSSRSHCIFTINVLADVKNNNDTVKSLGKLHLVDLAGSENAKNASLGSRRSATGSARERERLNINRSLLTLGRVIAAVKDASSGKKNIRIPYRDSKLTRILQEALGGRSKTLIVATVSPSQNAISESISTLNYAQSANGIQSKPVASTYHHQISSSMNTSRSSSQYADPTGAVEQWFELECKLKYMEAQIEEAQLALSRKEQQQQRINDRAEQAEHDLYEMETKFEEAEEKVASLEGRLQSEIEQSENLKTHLQNTEDELNKTSAILVGTEQNVEELEDKTVTLYNQLKAENGRCEDLTTNLINTKEILKQTSLVLKDTEQKLEDSLGRESNLEHHLKVEKERCEDLSNRLHSTEDTLSQTSAVLKDTQQKLEDSLGRESNLEHHLKVEKERCEDLTNRLHSTEDTLTHTLAVLKDTQQKLEDSLGRESNLEQNLKDEKERCDGLTKRLHETEDALMKTSAVLEATEKTEQKLLSEAKNLIHAMSNSVQDGDKLYALLEEARDADIERRKATRGFNLAAKNILQEALSKINVISDAESKNHNTLINKSNESHQQDKIAVDQSQKVLTEMNECVHSLTTTIKALSVEDRGVLPKFTTMTENIKGEIQSVTTMMEAGEDALNVSSEKSHNALLQYESRIKTMDENFIQVTESLRKEISAYSGEACDKMKSMVSGAMESISMISSSSIGTRKELSTILENAEGTSLKTSKDLGQRALEQHSKMETALGIFNNGMKQHDVLQSKLVDQLSVISDHGKSQLGELAGQAVTLSKQKQAFTDARQEQIRIQSEIMNTVMHGVEELLSKEMDRLTKEAEGRFNDFVTDNNEMSKFNSSIKNTTHNMVSETESRNKFLLECATDLHGNDSKLYGESILSNKTLMGIKETALQHHDFVSDIGRQTKEKLENLENLDEPVVSAMKKLDEERETADEYIVGTIIGSSDQGLDNLANKGSSQTNFVVQQIIPEVDRGFNELTNEQNRMYGDVSNTLKQVQHLADSGQNEVKSIIMRQLHEVEQLRDIVNSQKTDFENNVITPRKLNIKSRQESVLGEIENHYQATCDQLSNTTSLLTQVKGDVSSFAANVIHANEEVPKNEPRTNIPFTDKLSSTPSRQKIIANLNNSGFSESSGFADENNKMYINTLDGSKQSRDDVRVIRLDSKSHRVTH